jgi:predicted acylesterase/phospholipase RssA
VGAVRVALLLLAAGCAGRSLPSLADRPTPLAAGLNPVELTDPTAVEHDSLDVRALYAAAERVRSEVRPAGHRPSAKRSVLCLSGGGAYGAYTAGVLCGWTERGDRPTFDVVTGISTGALAAPLAFLGPDCDPDLRLFYTTLKNEDLYRLRRSVRAVFAESLADTGPLAAKIDRVITPAVLARLAAEHAKGRRLYIGTTELESRRQVVWDIGAIAARGRPDDLELVRKVLLASAAIPGFFPPVSIPVTVDGKHLAERHVDGGVSAALFYRPPHLSEAERADPAALSNTDLYMVVAGKLYADPNPVQPWSLSIAGEAVSAMIYALNRGDLLRLYTACVLTGMRYHLAAIPADFPAPTSSTDFNPADMKRMFDLGAATARDGTCWRTAPPGLGRGEGSFPRQGTDLVRSAEFGMRNQKHRSKD